MRIVTLSLCVGILLTGCGDPKLSKEEVKERFAASSPNDEGIALAVVFDNSGSMNSDVSTASGKKEKKSDIGIRSLRSVFDRLQHWSLVNTDKKVDFGVFIFDGDDGRTLLPLAPMDSDRFNAVLSKIRFDSSTPLGPAIEVAGKALATSRLNRRHMVVITDGEHNRGPSPEAVLGWLKTATEGTASINSYFIAFDINADVFEPVKKNGASVFSAEDDNSLNERLGFILDKKILLEEPDPQPAGQR